LHSHQLAIDYCSECGNFPILITEASLRPGLLKRMVWRT